LFPIPTIDKADVIFLKDRVEKGEYKPVIDSYYKLEQIVEPYKYLEAGQKTGNVVLKIVE
jgi:NADPH:quinone reductase-like Zn-dependent oxidoreductase